MTTHTEVTRFVPAKDVVTPLKTLEKASEEANDYKFQRAGNGHYVCKHGDNAYVIVEKMSPDGVPVIGCGCNAWTHGRDRDGCKHVVTFLARSRRPAAALSSRIKLDLLAAGWRETKDGNVYPLSEETTAADAAERQAEIDSAMDAKWNKEHPETATSDPEGDDNEGSDPAPYEEPDPVLDQVLPEMPEPPNEDYSNTPPEDDKPEPPGKVNVTCEHCMKRAVRDTQAEADEWLASHPCKENPHRKKKPEPELGDKVWNRKCPHCDQLFEGADLAEVKREHQDHIETCPQNPKNKDTTKPEPAPKVKPASRMITTTCDWCGDVLQHEDAAGLQTLIREHEAICPKRPEEPEQEATVAENATVEPQQEEETEMVERTKRYSYAHPDGTAFETAEELLDYADNLKAAQEMSDTKALMTPSDAAAITAQAWSDDQIEVMKKTVADKATPAEFAYFLNVAKYSGLNPFLREIYFMKTAKGQTAIITGRDGYLTIAKRDPRFKGVHSMEVCANDEFEMSYTDGVMEVSKHTITDFKDRGEIIGAWARGQMNGQDPITVFVSIKEYDKGGNIWNLYKSAMIRKVAESMVLKRIAGISGLVTDAEVSESKDMILDAEVV